MMEQIYTPQHVRLYCREVLGPDREITIIQWLKTHGAEYIFNGPEVDSLLRFENDADAIIFKLKFGL